jgi:hypothetical protein
LRSVRTSGAWRAFEAPGVEPVFPTKDDAISYVIGYAKHYSRSRTAVIHVYDDAGEVIEVHKHTGDFREP